MNPMEDGRSDRYVYDAEGQLTDAFYGAADPAGNPNSWQREDHFNLDALGNRRGWDYIANRAQWMNFTRKDNGLNQYRAWWPYSWINYDDDIGNGWGSPGQANGVIMQDGWVTAGYNALNQPMYIWSGGVGWTYFGYDPLGRGVKRWADNGSVSYLYYDGWNLIQDGPQSWNAEKSYIHGARVDEIVASVRWGWDVAYHHYDARGHCTLLTNSAGNIREQYDYDAFGYPYFYDAAGNNIGYSLFANRFLFTGREWLSDLKLYDYRNRLYQPELGRFLQPDPKEFAAGDYNLYRYCHNDPVNRADPLGLFEYLFHESFTASNQAHFWKVIQHLQTNSAHYRQMDAANKKTIVRIAATDSKHPTGIHNDADHHHYLHLDPSRSTYLDKASYDKTASFPKELPPRDLNGQAITVAHELGHWTGEHDEIDGGRNVEKNENPVRIDLLGPKHERETYLGIIVRVFHDKPGR